MKEDLIGGTCDIHGRETKYIKRWVGELKSDYLGLGVNGRIILKWILKIQSGRYKFELSVRCEH
jgi:hypothetical protein